MSSPKKFLGSCVSKQTRLADAEDCGWAAKVVRDGKPYCLRHDPVELAKKALKLQQTAAKDLAAAATNLVDYLPGSNVERQLEGIIALARRMLRGESLVTHAPAVVPDSVAPSSPNPLAGRAGIGCPGIVGGLPRGLDAHNIADLPRVRLPRKSRQ
jgi:hypothetical protein